MRGPDHVGVPDLVHALITMREQYAADELRARYQINGHDVSVTVTEREFSIATEAGSVHGGLIEDIR